MNGFLTCTSVIARTIKPIRWKDFGTVVIELIPDLNEARQALQIRIQLYAKKVPTMWSRFPLSSLPPHFLKSKPLSSKLRMNVPPTFFPDKKSACIVFSKPEMSVSTDFAPDLSSSFSFIYANACFCKLLLLPFL